MKNIINKRLKYILIITLLFLVINIAISLSYLNGTTTNIESVSTIVLKAGSLNIIYSSDNGNIVASDISPGYSMNKQFSITSDFGNNHDYYNRGIWYKIALIIEKNDFADDSLKYSLTVDNSSVVNGITAVESQSIGIKNGTNTNGISLGVGRLDENSESHVYNLLIEYPETGNDQSYEIGFEFNAHIEIIDTELLTITFDLDGGSFNGFTLFNNEIDVPINSTINLPIPNKDGYVFDGWEVLSGDVSANNNVITTNLSDIKLKASWLMAVYEFDYTGAEQEFIAEYSGYYKIEMWGAQGADYDSTYIGGKGSYGSGIIFLEENEKIYVYIGQEGSIAKNSTVLERYNGGGGAVTTSANDSSGAGGGATDVRLLSDDLTSRIMVASGGGGVYYHSSFIGNGGNGGGLIGGNPINQKCTKRTFYVGTPATQTSGGTNSACSSSYIESVVGSFGVGATGSSWASGGGGGYFGGGYSYATGASGGSSYISGHTGCVAIESDSSTSARTGTGGASCETGTTDNLCSVHYSGKVFTDTVMIDGTGYSWTNSKGALQQMPNPTGGYYASGVGHSGNGYARITFLHV